MVAPQTGNAVETPGKLTHDGAVAVLQFPSILTGTHFDLISSRQGSNSAVYRMTCTPVAAKAE